MRNLVVSNENKRCNPKAGQEKDSFIYLPLLKYIGCRKKGGEAIGSLPDVKEKGDTEGDAFYFSEGENRNAYIYI